MQDETTLVINRLKKPLFRKEGASPSMLYTVNDKLLYALTINPKPTCLLNKKLYRNYNDDQQRSMLGRIEACLRRKNPSIELIELHYEKCSAQLGGQIHFHALYSMPSIFQSTVMAYYRRLLDTNSSQDLIPWRYIDFNRIDNKEAWLQYIRKDINED